MTNYYEKAKAFGLEHIEALAEDIDQSNQFPKEMIEKLGEADFLRLNVPQKFGGLGLGFKEFTEVVIGLSEFSAAVGIIYTMHGLLVWRIMHANPDLQEKIYTDIVENNALGADGTSEGSAGVNIEQVDSTAQPIEDQKYKINGSKHMVTSAGYADYYTFVAKDTASSKVGTWIIPRPSQGLRFESNQWDGLGLRGNESSPMILENVVLDKKWYAGDNLSVTNPDYNRSLTAFHCGLAALNVGLNNALCSATLEHLMNRQFSDGKRLGEIEAVQLSFGEIYSDAIANFECLLSVTQQIDDGQDAMLSLLAARVNSAEKVMKSARLAMKLGGGRAFNKKVKIERLFRDAQAAHILVPGVDRLKLMIAQAMVQ